MDSGSWQTSNVFSNVADGSHTFYARDAKGNVSSGFTVALDTTPPAISTVAVEKIAVNNGTCRVTASDNIGVTHYRIDGGNWQSSNTFLNVTDGVHTFQVKDAKENISNTYSKRVDTTPPTGSVSKSTTAWTNGNVTLSLTCTDSGSGVQKVRFEQEGWVIGSSLSKTVTANGEYRFEIMDYDGNTAIIKTTVSNIDKAIPNAPTITKKPNVEWSNQETTISFSGGTNIISGVKQYQYSFDSGKTWEVCPSGKSISIAEEGIYNLVARAVSNSGNISTNSASLSVKIDQTNPTFTVTGMPTQWVQSATITVDPQDEDSGVDTVKVTDPKGKEYSLTAPYNLEIFHSGDFIFEVTDRAGNTKTEKKNIQWVDSEAPEISYWIRPGANRGSMEIVITAADVGTSGLDYVTLPDGKKAHQAQISYQVNKNGDYVFTATDHAKNTSKDYVVPIQSLIYSNDTSLYCTIEENGNSRTKLLTDTDARLSVPATGSKGTIKFDVNDLGAVILEIDGNEISSQQKALPFELEPDSELEYRVKVQAQDGTTAEYLVRISSKNEPPLLVIKNESSLQNTIFGPKGYYRNGEYQEYAEERGISIAVEVTEKNISQYVEGYCLWNNLKYPIEWEDGTETVCSKGKAINGTIFIPIETIQKDYSFAQAKIVVDDRNTEGGTSVSETTKIIRLSADVTPPEITGDLQEPGRRYEVQVSDSSRIVETTYRLAPEGGNYGKETKYSSPVSLEKGKQYEIKIKAKDAAGNVAEETRTVQSSDGSGEIEIKPENGKENLDTTIYYYKTRTASYYLINGGRSNETKVPVDNFRFISKHAS